MACGMMPTMYPGMQQYMPAMSMGMRMSLGMEMGMNRPVMAFSNILPSSPLPPPPPTTALATSYGPPRFPMRPFHMPHVPNPAAPESSSLTHSDLPVDSLGTLIPDQSCIPNTNFTDPYQQFLDPQQVQQLMQVNIVSIIAVYYF